MKKSNGTVSILLCSFNGEKYIREQLDSILSQTYSDWKLYISDDGSSDNTLNIISDVSRQLPDGKITVIAGPGKGFAENFLSLLKNKSIQTPYYAFCDQDDIWLNSKLEVAVRAVKQHEHQEVSKPILYGSKTILIDDKGSHIGTSPDFPRKLSLQNALVQSYAGGNTMVFNRNIKEIIENVTEEFTIISHDWFLYILASSLDGVIVYDKKPEILYRQHDDNLVGSNLGFKSKLERFRKIYSGEYKNWNRRNYEFLRLIQNDISDSNNKVIELYYSRKQSCLSRLHDFIRSGIYRQKKTETLFFMAMSFLGKLN